MTYTLVAIFADDCSVCEKFKERGNLEALRRALNKFDSHIGLDVLNLPCRNFRDGGSFSEIYKDVITWFPTFCLISEDNKMKKFDPKPSGMNVDTIVDWIRRVISVPQADQRIANLEKEIESLKRLQAYCLVGLLCDKGDVIDDLKRRGIIN